MLWSRREHEYSAYVIYFSIIVGMSHLLMLYLRRDCGQVKKLDPPRIFYMQLVERLCQEVIK